MLSEWYSGPEGLLKIFLTFIFPIIILILLMLLIIFIILIIILILIAFPNLMLRYQHWRMRRGV
jgi:hypothetical protein